MSWCLPGRAFPDDRPALGPGHVRRFHRRLGIAGQRGLLSGCLRRRLLRLSGPGRLPPLPDREHLLRRERLFRPERMGPGGTAGLADRGRRNPVHQPAGKPLRTGPRRPRPVRRCLGGLGGGVRTARGQTDIPRWCGTRKPGRSTTPSRPAGKPRTSGRTWLRTGRRSGALVRGKIYLYVGDTDTYYLNDAVQLLQQQLDAETSPPADATFVYGRAKPHGWSPYTTQQWFAIYAAYVAKHAPPESATTPWRGSEPAPASSSDTLDQPTRNGFPIR